MKLSEKGFETIFSALLKTIEERDLVFRQISQGVFKKHIEQLEFEPDDFEGCVMLTVEEAETFLNMTKFFRMFAQTSNHDRLGYLVDLEKELIDRIEQAEKGSETK